MTDGSCFEDATGMAHVLSTPSDLVHSTPSDDSPNKRCQRCGSEWLVRSRRRWWERLLLPRLKSSRPFRCRGCGTRKWFHVSTPRATGKNETFESLLFR
jgi:hypothetical protein